MKLALVVFKAGSNFYRLLENFEKTMRNSGYDTVLITLETQADARVAER